MPFDIDAGMTTFANETSNVSGYLARPKAAGPFAGLVVIQEWWGLVPHIKNVAERFAAEGYLTIAPDLYHGQLAAEPDGAMQLARSLAWESALHDLRATAKHLAAMPECNGKIASVGFCLGGGLSYRFAAHSGELDAAVIFYGSSPNQIEEASRVTCPLLGHYGEADTRITEAMPALVEELHKYGKSVETHVYPEAPHAFFNDEAPSYRAEAAQLAWQRTLDFFKRTLV
jgi:carboxymethylenebutenolidase